MSRSVARISLLVLATASFAPSLGAAQDACISPEAHAVLDACSDAPAATTPHGDDAPSHVMPVHRTTPAAPATPSVPGLDLDPRDEAAARRTEIRTRELLVQEITTLERMVDRGAHSAQHADYLARLADTELELQTYWTTQARALDQPIFAATQAPDEAEAARLRAQQSEAEASASAARDAAIHASARLVEEHPDYSNLDQVLYTLALALDQAGQHDTARQAYMRLLHDFPASRFVPNAWLSFAEHYFEQSDMPAAARFYERVLETPPESNPVYGYALYKLAWVRFNAEDFHGALTAFAQVLDFAQQHPDAHDAASIARQVRHELVLPYARVGRPSQALAFFRRYATDDAQALEMLESLGQLYEDTGQWPEAIQVYHQLMSEAPASDALCRWQSRVTSAVISSRPKPEQVIEAHRLVDVMNAFGAASHPPDRIADCRQTSATILVELATAWHRESIGDGTTPGTNDRSTMRLAAELYRLVTSELPDMERLEYPEIDRRDWPTLYRVSYFYAELLWRMDDYDGCGPAFDRVVTLDPHGEYTADASYGEVLCFDRVYAAHYAAHERERATPTPERPRRRGHASAAPPVDPIPEPPRALTDLENGIVHAFQRYLCTVPDGDERATVQYRLGRVYYEARRFEEASLAFRAVATEHPESELAQIAANLHLDSLNAIYRRDERTSCADAIRADVAPFRRSFCATSEASDAHAELCTVLVGLECDFLRLDAERIALTGDHVHAAPLYVALARDHAACGRRDEMLWNAAIEYEAAHLVGRAIQVRQTLVASFPDSALAHRAIYLIGASYHALAIYESAADWYERFAREHADADESTCSDADRANDLCAVAHVALENAVFFRIGLGQSDQAIADAALYERSYRRTRPHETADVIFSIGSIHEHAADWARVATHYRSFLRDYGRAARPDEVLRAHVQLGRATRELGQPAQAEPFFRSAVTEWEHGGADAIAAWTGTDEEHALWSAHARAAVSEARYWLAESQYEAFRAIRFPHFSGPRTIASVARWSTHDLGPWLARRVAALHTAEAAYDEIAALAIPEWEIAAAARVGEMYRTIVDDVRSAPVPEEIEDDDELYGIYAGTLENILDGSTPGDDGAWQTSDDVTCTASSTEATCVASPLRQATERFRYCLTLATRVRWFDAHSRACERELNAMDAAAYPLAAELRGTPSYDPDDLGTPRAVELDHADDDAEPTSTPASAS